MRWTEFVQSVRAHAPEELLPALAAESASQWTETPGGTDNPRGLQPWAMAAIARESLAWSNPHRRAPVTAGRLRRLQQNLIALQDPFTHGSIADRNDPWGVMIRLAYEQAPWQQSQYNALNRFTAMLDRELDPADYEVLSRPVLTALLGADPTDYAAAGTVFFASVAPNAGWFDLGWLESPQLAAVRERVGADVLRSVFLASFSSTYDQARERARSGRHQDPMLRRYDPNPLRAAPYVRMRDGRYLAPSQPLVVDRLSLDTVYYAGVAAHGEAFTRDLGRLLERYVGEQLALVPGGLLLPERAYGRGDGQKTVDWVLVLPDVVLVVEVKLARVTAEGRYGLQPWLDDVSRGTGKALRQVARTAALIRDRHPVLADVPDDRPVRGVVVTATQHYLVNQPPYRERLDDPTVPTTVLSLDHLEHAIGYSLLRDPSRAFLDLTAWDDADGVNPERTMVSWLREHGLERNPFNPLLDRAWRSKVWAWVEELPPD